MQLSKITALSAIMLSAASCEKGPSVQWPSNEGADSVKLSFVSPGSRSKSGFKGDEDTISDWAVFVFDKEGTPVKYITGEIDDGSTEIYVSRGAEYSFYILANLGDAIAAQGGYRALAEKNQDEFEMSSFKPVPCDKADGIAMAWARKNYVAQCDASIQVNLKRLYAKYTLSISRGKANNSEIHIRSVIVRQSRDALYPFCDNDGGEVADTGDYAVPLDIDALNRGESIALYVPRNIVCSNGVNPQIEDQWDKDMEVLADMGYEDLCSRCTYLEIAADYSLTERISPSQLRYFNGKTATWRFILGGDSTSDFDIEGNTIYHLTLQLTDEGVFRNCWRACLDDYSGNDCLLRWETGAGDACSANSIETICIENKRDGLLLALPVNGKAQIYLSNAARDYFVNPMYEGMTVYAQIKRGKNSKVTTCTVIAQAGNYYCVLDDAAAVSKLKSEDWIGVTSVALPDDKK